MDIKTELNVDNMKAQMRKGILEYCILLLLKEQERYAADLIEALRQADLIVVEGTLYPLILRLKKWNLLVVRSVESSFGPPRKYYSLSEQGYIFLEQLERNWTSLESTVNKIKQGHTAQ
ncbi:PadR family transcriptional regulator [Porphyromonas sp. COT-239 OH1446]|uniref:PadR family transcriptional regulator n=1 Tax=Porphyromonas sp. COT-239 OH1446 TaxID=1515613 RepID=UPI00052D75FF|nr:PadR family transcriptional regulator [Porphyromonas sp. COT-239 OH1446]KGN70025.1 PadR family transcriptional regulator [Porphyromonas sp. COT-239 OH1446]